jgi:cysteine desulfuration protein SufE
MTSSAFDTLKDDFEFIDDWEERYKYVIELGKNMPALDAGEQTEANKVHGCVSQVWIKTTFPTDENGQTKLNFLGDSDAMIVRGLVAVLRILMNDRPVKEVAEMNAVDELAQLGLNDHLTPQRSNGLNSMIKRLQSEAAAHCS